MTPVRSKAYVWLFLLLFAAMGGNVLLMQPRPPATAGSAAVILEPLASAEAPAHVPPLTRSAAKDQAPARAPDPAATRDTVKAVQRELTRLGYYAGPPDGSDTMLTRAAVWSFEQSRGLPVRAEPDNAILKELLFAADKPEIEGPALVQPRSPAADQILRWVQQTLSRAGYLAGPEGRMSDATTRAIRDFEASQGLAPTGRISAVLLTHLANPIAKPAAINR